MARRPQILLLPGRRVASPDVHRGEADRVRDFPRRDLLPAHQARKDRKTGRIRRRPAREAQRIGIERPLRERARGPARSAFVGRCVVKLVKNAVRRLDNQHVAIASARGAALDRRVGWDRIGSGVALVGVIDTGIEVRCLRVPKDRHQRLRSRHGNERNPVVVGEHIAPIGMQLGCVADRRDPIGRARMHRQRVDRGVPIIVRRKDLAPADGGRGRERQAGREGQRRRDEAGNRNLHCDPLSFFSRITARRPPRCRRR